MSTVYDKYVVIHPDKAPNSIVLVCIKHCTDCLMIELDLNSSQDNHTYTATTLSKQGIIDHHKSVLFVFGLSMSMGIIIMSCCTGCQNYTSVHKNNVISRELPSVLPSLFINF
jgi:hypothetical protein